VRFGASSFAISLPPVEVGPSTDPPAVHAG
jgi:hypothetical protein